MLYFLVFTLLAEIILNLGKLLELFQKIILNYI
jgi:hypothetical protein